MFDPYNEYKLNYNQGNTLELDIKQKWNIDGFDAVIGNPPYNKNLYKKFTEYSIKISKKILLFVIPSTFTIGVSGKKFIDLLKINGLREIKYLNRKIWLEQIDIDTLYLLCIKQYNGSIKINNSIKIEREAELRNIDNINYLNILTKIGKYEKLKLFKGKNKTLNYKNPTETDNIKYNKTKIHNYKLLSRLNGGRKEEIYYVKEYQEKEIIGVKILFPRGTASYNSITNLKKLNKDIVYSKITEETILLSTGIVYILCDDLKEAKIMQWYLMRSKFVRFLFIKENKFSELTKGFVNLIPKIKINKTEDSEVYRYFNLTQNEINLIEDTIK